MKRLGAMLMMAGGLLVAGGANAAVTITLAQVGNDVVATAAGTLTLPGATSSFSGLPGAIGAQEGRVIFANNSNFSYINCLTPSPGPFGTGPTSYNISSFNGDVFGILALYGNVFLPTAFVSGGAINSTITFTNITIASLGLNAGGTTYTCGTDTITVRGSAPTPTAQAVPSLSEWAQLMLGLMVLTMIGWQWRKQQS